MTEDIESLARRCAVANLNMRQARMLFHALYTADALALSQGNVTKAAERMGVGRSHVIRMMKVTPEAGQ